MPGGGCDGPPGPGRSGARPSQRRYSSREQTVVTASRGWEGRWTSSRADDGDDQGEDPVRVALAEDGALFREGLVLLLDAAGHDVVGCTADGDSLVKLLADDAGRVAILDIRMPPEPDGGLSTAERAPRRTPGLGLLFLSHYAEAHYLMRILRIGTEAIGYRLKEKVGSVDVLTDTLTRIQDGEIVIEPVLAQRLVERPSGNRRNAVASLSERESDVLRLMAEGRSNSGIAGSYSSPRRPSRRTSPTSSRKLDLHADTSSATVASWRS